MALFLHSSTATPSVLAVSALPLCGASMRHMSMCPSIDNGGQAITQSAESLLISWSCCANINHQQQHPFSCVFLSAVQAFSR